MSKSAFTYITPEYVSNCAIEAFKAKLKDPRHVKLYFCKPSMTQNGNLQFCHFMWADGTAGYDFSDRESERLPWWKCFLFKGQIRQFRRGFVERYTRERNRKDVTA